MDKVVHFEIPADDPARAQKFYETVFGWHIISMPHMQYAMVHTGPTNDEDGMVKESAFINGGMLKRQDPIQHPVITISVDSIEKAGKDIQTNGGAVIRDKMPVGDFGFAAYFKDSEGNVLGLWEDVKK